MGLANPESLGEWSEEMMALARCDGCGGSLRALEVDM